MTEIYDIVYPEEEYRRCIESVERTATKLYRYPLVMGLSFHNRPNFPSPRVEVTIKGHPVQALEKARLICNVILEAHGPWKITEIEYDSPPDTKPESEGVLTVSARVKGI